MFKIAELTPEAGKEVSVSGFVSTVRVQGKLTFLILQSKEELLQCVGFGAVAQELAKILSGSWVRLEGMLKLDERAKAGVELSVRAIADLSLSAPAPVCEETASSGLMEFPGLRLRTPVIRKALEHQSLIQERMRGWFKEQGFTEIHSPKLMGTPSESGSEVFEVKHFGEKAWLAQSAQFYKQLAIIGGMEKVFEIGSTFRAEHSFSTRHATEFMTIDVEIEEPGSVEQLVRMEHSMLEAALAESIKMEFITYGEAKKITGMGRSGICAEEERVLGAHFAERGVELIALLEMPAEIRPFYHKLGAGGVPESFDLIYRGTEITTGAVREHRFEVLMEQAKRKGLTGKGAEWYFEAFKYGAPPHGGFGLGLERLVALHLGLPSIKEATMIPRTPSRLTP